MERAGCDRFAFSASRRLFFVHCALQDVCLADKLPHYLGREAQHLSVPPRPWRNLHTPSDSFACRSRTGLGDFPSPPAPNHGQPLSPFDHHSGAFEPSNTHDKEDFGLPLTHSTKSVPVPGNRQRAFAPPGIPVVSAGVMNGLSRGNHQARYQAMRATSPEILRSFQSGPVLRETTSASRLPAALRGFLPRQIRIRERHSSLDTRACLSRNCRFGLPSPIDGSRRRHDQATYDRAGHRRDDGTDLPPYHRRPVSLSKRNLRGSLFGPDATPQAIG